MMTFRKRLPVVVILLVSLGLRWVLIFQGGQFYFPDETRYLNSQGIALSIIEGDYGQAASYATDGIGHWGFEMIGVIPALFERYFHLSSATPAIFFSFFSILSLYLIWKITLRIRMSEREALFALFVAASSHSLTYFSRHLLPYDLSLFFGLWALYLGLDDRHRVSTSLISGLLGFLCFISYNGYWILAGFSMVFPLFYSFDKKSLIQDALLVFTGFVTPLLLLAILVSVVSNVNLLHDFRSFSKTVAQGSYAEGWSLPFEYLWHVEHSYLLFIILFSLYAITKISRNNLKYLALGIGGIAVIYICLVIPSSLLHSFVIYGRSARQLLPFLILASTQGLFIFLQNAKFAKQIMVGIIIIVCIQALYNFRSSYEIVYQKEFIEKVIELYPFNMSQKRTNSGATPICKYKEYIIVNAKYIHPIPETTPPIHEVPLLFAPHPINFLPYQYEGYKPKERQILRDAKPQIGFYKVTNNAQDFALLEEIKSCMTTK